MALTVRYLSHQKMLDYIYTYILNILPPLGSSYNRSMSSTKDELSLVTLLL